MDVGQVLTITRDRARPEPARAGGKVGAGTPVGQGTQAMLQSQGVTGVSLVGPESFAAEALPRFKVATGKAKRLIDRLRRLSAQIECDPARLFSGNRMPEYSR